MNRKRDKYPKLSTRRKLGIQFATDHPNYRMVAGYIHENGKIVFPPRKPEDFCKTLVECGYLIKKGKGSPWEWVDKHYTSMTWRVYPYNPENAITNNEKKEQ